MLIGKRMPEEEEQQCVFCHIASGKIPSKKVFEDDKVTAVLDINPATPGHILVLTKEHVAIMPQMTDELVAHVGMVAKQLGSSVLRTLKVEGTSIFVANGMAAGQRAPHFMLHVIPRSADDGIALQPGEIKVDEKAMKDIWQKLAASVAKQFGKEPPKAAKTTVESLKSQESKDSRELEDDRSRLSSAEKPKELPKEKLKPEKGLDLDRITDLLTGGKK